MHLAKSSRSGICLVSCVYPFADASTICFAPAALFAKCWTRLDIRVQAANSSATPIQLEQILPLAHSICMSAQICILNSGVDGDARWTPSLNYSAGTVATNIIAIGGYKLSRGLAIRGLIVSLLANGAKESVQDALSQLLRLLGHRGRDRDLMCVHMPERLHADYIRLADIYTKDRNGLRDFVVKRLNGEDPPAPEVAAHASMKPTNSTKMRYCFMIESVLFAFSDLLVCCMHRAVESAGTTSYIGQASCRLSVSAMFTAMQHSHIAVAALHTQRLMWHVYE